jgi:hypothetical protein
MISNMVQTGASSNIIYDTGVLTSAQQTISIPDSVTSGRTCLQIRIDGVYGNGSPSFAIAQLFVNSDTTASNYATTYLTRSGAGASAGESATTELGATLKNERSFIVADVAVVNGRMFFQSFVNRDVAGTGGPDLIMRTGKYHASTVTDLSGMSIVSTDSLGFNTGTRIQLIAFS